MTRNLKKLIMELQGTPSLISEFLDNPSEICNKYKITENEKRALLSGNVEDLINLGISNGLVAGVLSGAHTSTCSTSKKTTVF